MPDHDQHDRDDHDEVRGGDDDKKDLDQPLCDDRELDKLSWDGAFGICEMCIWKSGMAYLEFENDIFGILDL